MILYRKKPVVIEAVQFNATGLNLVPAWLADAINLGVGKDGVGVVGGLIRMVDTLHIFTLEGTMIASDGDYIIRGVKGELYPCKPDIFLMTYEPVEATP